MSELVRVGGMRTEGEKDMPDMPPYLEVWLDDLQGERDCLIMRLRQIDRALVRHGRLKQETLERRIR